MGFLRESMSRGRHRGRLRAWAGSMLSAEPHSGLSLRTWEDNLRRVWRLTTEPPRCPPKPCFYMFYMFYFVLQKKYICITKIQNSLYKKAKVSYKPNAFQKYCWTLRCSHLLEEWLKTGWGKTAKKKTGTVWLVYSAPLGICWVRVTSLPLAA